MKVFAMNDCDWMAGESLESVTAHYLETCGVDYDLLDEPHELTDADMQGLRFHIDESHNGPTISFREQLDRLISEGQQFPCFFASTEY